MRVIVVGAGLGGLAAALELARRGAEVTVLERAAAFGEAGAGVQLSPNATRLLIAAGLDGALRRIGFVPDAAEVRDRRDGALLLRSPLGAEAERRWGAPYLQAHRADLHALLLEAATGKGASVRIGVALEEIAVEGEDEGVVAHTSAGALRADVLVGADGVRSRVRAAITEDAPPRFAGEVAWRGLVPTERLPPGLIAPNATVWTGRGAHFVHYFVRGGTLVNFAGFTTGPASPESWSVPAASGEIARAFAGWPEPVRDLLAAQAEAGESGWRFAVHDRPPSRIWAKGPVVLLGDAAHPLRPHLAQGAGMAIEDAEALARHLAGPLAPPDALQAYVRERQPRVRRVQAWAERNGHVFHLPRPLRRAAFAVARAGAADLDWLYGYRPPQA